MASFQDRVIGALKLQGATFEEVEHDPTAMSQAAIVVLAASVSSGLASIWFLSFRWVVYQAVIAIVAWVVGTFLIWVIGTKVLPGKNTQADIVQVLRPLGFAQAPGVFSILGMIPFLGWLIWLVVLVWTLAATVIAVRQALDYDDTVKAAITVILAYVAAMIVSMLIGSIVGFGAMGRGMMF